MSAKRRLPPPPKHLSAAAKTWWRELVGTYELEGHHLKVLRAACEAWDRLNEARLAAALGEYPAGVEELNRVLGVSSAGELPDPWKGDHALAALERASLLQASEAFEDSAKNLMAADRELELYSSWRWEPTRTSAKHALTATRWDRR